MMLLGGRKFQTIGAFIRFFRVFLATFCLASNFPLKRNYGLSRFKLRAEKLSSDIWGRYSAVHPSANERDLEDIIRHASSAGHESGAEQAEIMLNRLMKSGHIPSDRLTSAMISLYGAIGKPEKAESVFDKISFAGSVFGVEVYNSLIASWANSTSSDALLKAEELFRRMQFSGVAADLQSYELMLNVWANADQELPVVARGRHLYDLLKQAVDAGYDGQVASETYTAVFSVFARSLTQGAPELMSSILCVDDGTRNGGDVRTCIELPPICYVYCLASWLATGDEQVVMHIDAIVQALNVKVFSQPRDKMERKTFVSALESANIALVLALCRRYPDSIEGKVSDVSSLLQADELLASLEEKDLVVPTEVYVTLVDAWCRAGDPRRAERVLDRLSDTIIRSMESHSNALTNVFKGHRQKFYELLVDSCESRGKFNAQPWNQVMTLYASWNGESSIADTDTEGMRSGILTTLKSAESAERTFQKLQATARSIRACRKTAPLDELSKLRFLRPDQLSYDLIIGLWSNCGRMDLAEDKFVEMIKSGSRPTTMTYTSLIKGWLANPSAVSVSAADIADKVKALFSIMCKQVRERVEEDPASGPHTGSESLLLEDAFYRIADAGIPPSLDMYKELFRSILVESRRVVSLIGVNVRIDGTVTSDFETRGAESSPREGVGESYADRAVALFQHLSTYTPGSQQVIGSDSPPKMSILTPDLECYESLTEIFESCSYREILRSGTEGGASFYPERALDIASHMLRVGMVPSRKIYCSLLRMWVISKRPDAPRVCDSIFRSMIARTGFLRDSVSSGGGYGNGDDREPFLLLLEAWARSPLPGSAKKCEEVLTTMRDAGRACTPNARAYSLLAYAWSKTWKWDKSRQQESATLQENDVVPEYVTKTEDVLSRCLAANITPDASFRRSLLSVWCRHASPGRNLAYTMAYAGVPFSPLSATASVSLNKAESLLKQLSVALVLKTVFHQLNTTGDRRIDVDVDGGGGLVPMSISCTGETSDAMLLPHPSVYMQVATAWAEYSTEQKETDKRYGGGDDRSGSGSDSPSSPPAIAAARLFLERATYEINETFKRVFDESSASLDRNMANNRGLYISNNLLLAAHVVSLTRSTSPRQTKALVDQAEALYRNMSRLTNNALPLADAVSLNLLIEAIRRSNTSPAEVAARCEAILKDIPPHSSTQPNDFTFELMAKVWNAVQTEGGTRFRSDSGGVGSRAQALFERIYQNAVVDRGNRATINTSTSKPYFLGVPALSPSVATYSALIEVWCSEDPERALKILDRMSQLCRDRCEEVLARMLSDGYKPDPESCRLLLAVHAGADSADSADRVDGVLQRLSQAGVKVDPFMLASQLQAWGRSKSLSAPRKAEAAFAAGVAAGVAPSVELYNLLIGIHGRSAQADAPENAEAVLGRMRKAGLEPDISSYNAAISAWGRSNRPDAERRSHMLLQLAVAEGLKPDVITYSSLLSALSKSRDKDAPLRADEVFDRMQASGIEADTVAWNILITIWSRSKLKNKEERVQQVFDRMISAGAQPSEITYTAMLAMWGNSGSPRASEGIIEVFRHMQSTGRQLDTVGYSSLLSALSKSRDKDAPLRADEVFERMQASGIEADTVAWTILITIWSRSNLKNKEERVQQVFDRMLASGSQPNAVTYTSLLLLWSNSKLSCAKDKVLEIYERIWSENVRLDGKAFKVLLISLGRVCARSEALVRAERILARLADFEMPPDASAWVSLIDADADSWWLKSTTESRQDVGVGGEFRRASLEEISAGRDAGGVDATATATEESPHVRALRLYRSMIRAGVIPTDEVCVSVFAAFARSPIDSKTSSDLTRKVYLLGRKLRLRSAAQKFGGTDTTDTSEAANASRENTRSAVTSGDAPPLETRTAIQDRPKAGAALRQMVRLILEALSRTGEAREAEEILSNIAADEGLWVPEDEGEGEDEARQKSDADEPTILPFSSLLDPTTASFLISAWSRCQDTDIDGEFILNRIDEIFSLVQSQLACDRATSKQQMTGIDSTFTKYFQAHASKLSGLSAWRSAGHKTSSFDNDRQRRLFGRLHLYSNHCTSNAHYYCGPLRPSYSATMETILTILQELSSAEDDCVPKPDIQKLLVSFLKIWANAGLSVDCDRHLPRIAVVIRESSRRTEMLSDKAWLQAAEELIKVSGLEMKRRDYSKQYGHRREPRVNG